MFIRAKTKTTNKQKKTQRKETKNKKMKQYQLSIPMCKLSSNCLEIVIIDTFIVIK